MMNAQINQSVLPEVNPVSRCLVFVMNDGSRREDARYSYPVWSATSRRPRVFFKDGDREEVIHGFGGLEVLSAAVAHAVSLQPAPVAPAKSEYRQYEVVLRFQFPAWDEKDGIPYGVSARSRSDAIKQARRDADRDGHLCGGKGRVSFKAHLLEESPASA